MALTLTVQQQNVDASGHIVYVYGTIAASGSYTTGGDTLSLSGQPIPSSQLPISVTITSQAGQGYNYVWVQGTSLTNGKMKIFSAGTELAAGAYPAAITGDVISFQAAYPKLQ